MSQYEALFKRNVAVGESQISSDTIFFRFKHEEFVIPTCSSVGIATFNGECYTAKVDKLRKLMELIEESLNG